VSTRALPRRSRVRRLVWPAARIAIVALVVALAVLRVDWGAVRDAFKLENSAFIFLAIVANFTSVVFKGLAWKGVVDGLPELKRPTRLRDLLSPLFVGFLFNTVLAARVGEIVKVLLARRHLARRGENVRTTVLLGTVVVENLVSTVAWVAFVFAIGIFLPLPSYAWISATVLGAGALSVIIVALLRRPGRPLPPWLNTGPIWARVTRALARFWAAVQESHLALREPRRLTLVALPSLLTWLAQWVGIYCTLVAFGLEEVGWGGAGLLLVTVTLAQTFPVLPGNLVVFQAAAVVPLTASYGVGAADAIAFSIVLQATEVAVSVLVGFVFLLMEGVGFGELRREAEAEGQSHPEALVDTLGGI
jgi:uncharacterized membrane protein YbhN (UPF0104 family)